MRQRVLEQERRFRTLVQASSDVVYSMSPDWGEMRHLQGRDFIADTTEPNRSWLDKYIHPDDQERMLAAIQDAIRGKKTFQLEHRVLRVDGTLGWTFSRAIPVVGPEGEIVEWLGAASDITARKERGERAARGRPAQGRVPRDARRTSCATRWRRCATALQLLRAPAAIARTARVREMMERQVNHLVRLVDDLLEMSRITRGTLELRQERVELAAIVRNAVETSQPLVQARRPPRSTSRCRARRCGSTAIRCASTQVLANLLNNAAKYTDDGGTIALSARREGDDRRRSACATTAAASAAEPAAHLRDVQPRGPRRARAARAAWASA